MCYLLLELWLSKTVFVPLNLESFYAPDYTKKISNLQVESLGGQCIPVQCDHSNDDEVKQLFERVKKEQNGKLDVLVNNAYKAVKVLQLLLQTTGGQLKYFKSYVIRT